MLRIVSLGVKGGGYMAMLQSPSKFKGKLEL